MRHSETNDKILILIITPTQNKSYDTERQLCGNRGELNCVCFHADGVVDTPHSICDKCELVLIDQCQSEDDVKKIITCSSQLNKKFLVWSHGTEVSTWRPISPSDIGDWIGEDRIVNDDIRFHHYSDCDAEKIMNAYLQDDRDALTDLLAGYSTKHEATNINDLRSKVLTPLVALDLLLQAQINDKQLLKDIQAVLGSEEYNDNAKKLLDNISSHDQSTASFVSECFDLIVSAKGDAGVFTSKLKNLADLIEERISQF